MRKFTQFVKKHFGKTEDLIGVEVGVWQGGNALNMIEYLKPKLLILIDVWNELIEKVDIGQDGSQEKNFISTYQKFASRTDVIIIKGASKDVAGLLRGEFDFVYIDACHSMTEQDIECWYPLVKSGGILGGHDYNMDGVSVAVNAFFTMYDYDKSSTQGIDWRTINGN
ncbi:class I SAM-dependent methyltransferase [bacterium]|nr:class I SAM-dependent methyltransferase [bacterium]